MLNTLGHSFNIIGLSETWISSNKDSFVNPFLPGFDFISQPSKLSFGGVGLLIANSLRYSVRDDLNSSSDLEESLWIEVLNGTKKNIVGGVVYSTKAEEGLPTSTSDFRLQTSDFRLQTSDFRLQTSDFSGVPLWIQQSHQANHPVIQLSV